MKIKTLLAVTPFVRYTVDTSEVNGHETPEFACQSSGAKGERLIVFEGLDVELVVSV